MNQCILEEKQLFMYSNCIQGYPGSFVDLSWRYNYQKKNKVTGRIQNGVENAKH